MSNAWRDDLDDILGDGLYNVARQLERIGDALERANELVEQNRVPVKAESFELRASEDVEDGSSVPEEMVPSL